MKPYESSPDEPRFDAPFDEEDLEFLRSLIDETLEDPAAFNKELDAAIARSTGILHGFREKTADAFARWFPKLKEHAAACQALAATADRPPAPSGELAAEQSIIAEKLTEYARGGAGIPPADLHRALLISVDQRHLPPAIDFAGRFDNVIALSLEEAARWRESTPEDINEACWLREWTFRIFKADHEFDELDRTIFYGDELIREVQAGRAWLVYKSESLGRGCAGSTTEVWTWDGTRAAYRESCASIHFN